MEAILFLPAPRRLEGIGKPYAPSLSRVHMSDEDGRPKEIAGFVANIAGGPVAWKTVRDATGGSAGRPLDSYIARILRPSKRITGGTECFMRPPFSLVHRETHCHQINIGL